MKILYCITGLGIGGAEIITVNLANRMVGLGHEVFLLFLSGDNELYNNIDSRIKIEGLHMSKNIFGFLKAQLKMREIVTRYRPDLIHSNMIHANLFCRFLRLHKRIYKLICTEHSNNIESDFRMFMYTITDFLSDVNTNVSEVATSLFIKKKAFGKFKTLTVYNGIDMNVFVGNNEYRTYMRISHNISDRDFVFLNVGRLVPAKDQKTLIEAFSRLCKIYIDIKLIIVGDGCLFNELRDFISFLSLDEHIVLAGSCNNVVDYYNAADCFVLSSAWEGFGIVLAEAMACNLPVITTDAGGCAEVIDNSNYVVPIRSCDKLFYKMKEIYEMSFVSRKKLGEHNRIIADRFNLDTICDRWINIYESTGLHSIV